MSEQVVIADTRALFRLREVLQKYREVSRKSWADILAKETNEWRFELWGGQGTAGVGFKRISPTPDAIIGKAKARGYRVHRSSNTITQTEDGISRAASAAAASLLGGQKSELFRVEANASGVFVKPIRFSGRKSAKILRGGRSGRKFADSARRAREVEDVERVSQMVRSDPSIKILNKRALGVAIELGLRSRAAKGGTMALQWLGTNFTRRKSSTVKTGPVVVRSSKGIPLGIVEFHGEGDTQTSTLSALVPGTATQAARHGIFGKVAAVRIADRGVYITRKLEELKQEALRK